MVKWLEAGDGSDADVRGKLEARLELKVSDGAALYARIGILCLAMMCQSVVGPGQPQPQPLSAKIVNDVDTSRLGALPTAAGWIAGLPMRTCDGLASSLRRC